MPGDSTVVIAHTVKALSALTTAGVGTGALAGSPPGTPAGASSLLNVWTVLASAFFGAFFAFLFARYGDWLSGRVARGKVHRTALVRLERVLIDYLNDIITNRKLAFASQKATAAGHLYWKFPHTFEVDKSYTMEVFDIEMTKLIVGLNTNLRRYNYDVEDLRRAHSDLQQAHLGQTLPIDDWKEAMGRMAPHWGELAGFLDDAEDEVCNVKVCAYLFVKQYDSTRAAWLRWFGILRSWPLDPKEVEQERKKEDETRKQQLAESAVKQAAARDRAQAAAGADSTT